MEWSDVRLFLAVARQGSLGSAARTLSVSHPTLARRMRALEQDVGQPLFQRHHNGVLLTDAGAKLFQLAEEMEATALTIERRLADEKDRFNGPLRISSADWFATYVLPPVLTELARMHPCLLPEVSTSSRLYDLSRREADIAFRIIPFDEPQIVQCRLLRIRYGLYARSDVPHPLPLGGKGMGLLLMDTTVHSYPDVAWLQTTFPEATPAVITNHRALQARLCQQGLGLAVLPAPVGDATPGLVHIELDTPPPCRHIWMGYHEDMRGTEKVRALADLATRLLTKGDDTHPDQI